jgi:hypothetical protein
MEDLALTKAIHVITTWGKEELLTLLRQQERHLDGPTVKRYYRAESIIRTSPRQLYGES